VSFTSIRDDVYAILPQVIIVVGELRNVEGFRSGNPFFDTNIIKRQDLTEIVKSRRRSSLW